MNNGNEVAIKTEKNITNRKLHDERDYEHEAILNDQCEKFCDGVIKFRPFGILEPQSARNARKNMKSLFPLLCDAANIHYQVRELDKEIAKLSI
ncbi:hypothetical protein Mgra_00000342 [Meloidogyne graminicola]|uniref:Uncharacterized protein n=1 Tax=Meloidogyne graminicola TaxID=189291 RepID=A0A8T0A5C6_9BILA|nr:hypothetical protein Mgra_00000342 [Meloidogyne graminicola]